VRSGSDDYGGEAGYDKAACEVEGCVDAYIVLAEAYPDYVGGGAFCGSCRYLSDCEGEG
jgi:hypothetical protein